MDYFELKIFYDELLCRQDAYVINEETEVLIYYHRLVTQQDLEVYGLMNFRQFAGNFVKEEATDVMFF